MAIGESLDKALLTILDKTVTTIDASVNFLAAEIPEIVKELLLFNLVSNSVYVVLVLSLIGLSVKVLSTTIPHWSDSSFKESKHIKSEAALIVRAVSSVVALLILLIPLIFVFSKVSDIIKILIAPRLYLIEYAASLVK